MGDLETFVRLYRDEIDNLVRLMSGHPSRNDKERAEWCMSSYKLQKMAREYGFNNIKRWDGAAKDKRVNNKKATGKRRIQKVSRWRSGSSGLGRGKGK